MSDSEDDACINAGERRVVVAVRMRPKKSQGPERYDSACVHIDHGQDLLGASGVLSQTRASDVSERPSSFSGRQSNGNPTVVIADPEGKVDPLTFAFDRVFDDTDDQETVYQEIVHGPVLSALESGGDALFVAYGQTGSGKTYTMLGEEARYASGGSAPERAAGVVSPTTAPLSLAGTMRSGARLDQTLSSPGKVAGGTTYFADGGCEPLSADVADGAGVLMRVMNTVLRHKERREGQGPDQQWHVVVAMSAVEVYNDSLFDLLAANGGARAQIKSGPNARNVELDVREFGDDLFITNLQRFVISSTAHVQAVFDIALKNRSVAPTSMNDTSSRSHAIFTAEVFLQRRSRANPDPPDPGLMAEHLIASTYSSSRSKRGTATPSPPPTSNPSNDFATHPFVASRITMADLAGNERVKKSGVSGKELSEAVAVNKSLSALGHVVHQICQGSRHISFRDAKVTRLLRSAFSNPKSKITFITNVSPIGLSYPETVCSLRFAARLKELKPVATAAAPPQATAALKEDQMLQRLHVFEQLAADFRILRDGYDYKPQAARWRKSTGNARLTAKGAANRYESEVRELQETRRVLELEQYVQEFASTIRLSSSTAEASSAEAAAAGGGSERQQQLRAELEALDKANAEERAATAKAAADVAKLQEQMNAANRLLGVKGDAQRAIAALAKEEEAIAADIRAAVDPSHSDYGQAQEALAQEKAGKAADEAINAANAQFATRLLEHNRSKIAVRAERIEQVALRNAIDARQQQIMALFSMGTMRRVRVPIAALAGGEALDMKQVLEVCSVRHPATAPLRDDQLIDGPEALAQLMTRRLKAATTEAPPNVSPIAFYVSPQSAAQLSSYLEQATASGAHGRTDSSAVWDSDDELPTADPSGSNNKKGSGAPPPQLTPPLALFEAMPEARRRALRDSLMLLVTHGRVLQILDGVHAARLVDAATLQRLFTALDKVPLDVPSLEAIVACAKRRSSGGDGSDGDSSSEWSGDELELESNMGSSDSLVGGGGGGKGRGAASKASHRSAALAEHTRRVMRRLLERIDNPSHVALIRCAQAHTLFRRVDALCSPTPSDAQSPSHMALCRIVAEVRRRAMLRRILDVEASPIAAPAATAATSTTDNGGAAAEGAVTAVASPKRAPAAAGGSPLPSAEVLPPDALDAFVNSIGLGDSDGTADAHLSYLSPFAAAAASQVLAGPTLTARGAISSNGSSAVAGIASATQRDVSLIAFYGSRIIDSACLTASPGAKESVEAIPYMPSTVRFAEMMLMCCGYRR